MKLPTFTTYALLVTCSLFGQGFQKAHNPPTAAQIVAMEVARLTALLSLDSAEAVSATSYLTTEESALTTLKARMAAAKTQLTAAVEAADSTNIANASTQIGVFAGKETLARATAESALYAILTTEQQAKYKLLFTGGYLGHGGPRIPFGPQPYGQLQ